MTSKPRGRPAGTSPKKAQDDVLLLKAAEMLVRLQVGSPSAAFKKLVGEGNDVDRRRLQRRWSSDGDTFINKAQEPFFHERWEKEARALKEAAPDLYEKVTTFVKSQGGAELLLSKGTGDEPIHFMSLGIISLNEWLKKTTMHGAEKAQEVFPKIIKHWGKFGVGPDPEFLRIFAELCLAKADEVEAIEPVKDESGKS